MSSAYDNMRLNVDLKPHGSDRGFTIGKNLQYDQGHSNHQAYSFLSKATLRSPSSIPLLILILCILAAVTLLLFILISSETKGWNKVVMSILCLGLLVIAVSYFIYGWNAYAWFNI